MEQSVSVCAQLDIASHTTNNCDVLACVQWGCWSLASAAGAAAVVAATASCMCMCSCHVHASMAAAPPPLPRTQHGSRTAQPSTSAVYVTVLLL